MANGIFIISAPSGSGKSTLVRRLLGSVDRLRFSISYTTRAPRGGEENGREYFFISKEQFRTMAAEGQFLEHAEVFGNGYGTAWSFVRQAFNARQDIVLDIDVQGARQVRRCFAEHAGTMAAAGFAASIFIAPPDRETLARRLNQRGLDRPEVIETRLREASEEIKAYNDYDYILINDHLHDSVRRLEAIVRWERSKHSANVEDRAEQAGWRELAESCLQSHAAAAIEPVLGSFRVQALSSRPK